MSKAETGYDSLARWYRMLEYMRFGRTLQQARTALLDTLPKPQTALFLGDGDGRLLSDFAQRFPMTRIVSVDLSQQMLQLQRNRLRTMAGVCGSNIEWIHADAIQLEFSDASFDLIVTPFFLDVFCQADLHILFRSFAAWLTETGHLYVVDFRQPSAGAKYYWAKFWLGIMHQFFRWQTALEPRQLCDLQGLIAQAGFCLLTEKRAHYDMIFSAVYSRSVIRTF